VCAWATRSPRPSAGLVLRGGDWRADLLAGFTAVALLAPECVAYARIAGIPPSYVLSAAPVGLAAYAILGRSVSLIVGATAATTVISAAVVSGVSGNPAERTELIAALAVLAGTVLIVTGAARFGFITRFLTEEALTGFLAALAIIIFVRQFGAMVGMKSTGGDLYLNVWHIASRARHWNGLSLAVGLTALMGLLLLEKYLPKLPAALVVLVIAWFASTAWHLHDHGVAVVGNVPGRLPTLVVPTITSHMWARLLYGAAGLALITFVMSYSVSQLVAVEGATHPNANREMQALGASNVLSGLFGGLAVGGSPSASSAAHGAGARTRLTAATAILVLVAVAKYLTPAFGALPEPVLAAVVIVAVRHLISFTPFKRYWTRDRRSLAVAVTAVVGVLTFDLLPGLLLAVALSLVIFVADSIRLEISELGQIPGTSTYMALERHTDAVRHAGISILRPNGEVFFANVEKLLDSISESVTQAEVTPLIVLLDLTSTFRFDLAALDGLVALRRRLSRGHIDLWFAHVYLSALDAVSASELSDVPIFDAIDDAVHAFERPQDRGQN
jgi:SulP family sulfate permease